MPILVVNYDYKFYSWIYLSDYGLVVIWWLLSEALLEKGHLFQVL